VTVQVRQVPDCAGWTAPGPFTVVVREEASGPWLVESLNTGP
jgi:hypothetical protein